MVGTPAEPLAAISLLGTFAYTEKCVNAGTIVSFRVSSDGPYRLSLVRLGWDLAGPARDWVIEEGPLRDGGIQPIRPGSYVHIPEALPSSAFAAITLECWVRPSVHKWQGLITQYTYPERCGLGLFLDPNAMAVAYFGDGGNFRAEWLTTSTTAVATGSWVHLAAVFDNQTVSLWVDGVIAGSGTGPIAADPGPAPLRLAAYGESGQTSDCLDGDLAMPAIYRRALSPDEISERAATLPPSVPDGTDTLGCWPMTEERGQSVSDASSHGRTGEIINHATWMIGGPGFDAAAVDRFDPSYDPSADPSRGHALRFSSEDLFDCQWAVTDSFQIPADLASGVCMGRIQYGPGLARRYDVGVVVKPAPSKPQAKILVLCATNTWLAYNVPFPNAPDAVDGWGTGGHGVSVPGAPGFNLYDNYRDSLAPPFQMGLNMPWSAFPYAAYFQDYAHLLRAERPLHIWLEQQGYDYDVAGDFDADGQPAIFADYEIVVLNGHSEYWSAKAQDGLDAYLAEGGQVIVLSGNTMFWRVSFDESGDIMECRKLPSGVGGRTDKAGEIYHSHDGKRGGLMRECGYPAWRVIGLECVGYDGGPGGYSVETPEHPFFRVPEYVPVAAGSEFAYGSVGHEYDTRLASVPGDVSPPPPDNEPVSLARSVSDGSGKYFDYRGEDATEQGVRSEVIDWPRETGGRVFGMGTIAAGRQLPSRPELRSTLRNVLHHFGSAQRLNLFVVADGRLKIKWWDGEAWGPSFDEWEDAGGKFADAAEPVVWAPERLALMGRDPSGHLQYRWWDGAQWLPVGEWADLGGNLQGRQSAVGWGRDRMDIFAVGLDDHVHVKSWDGETWLRSLTEWLDLGGTMLGAPAGIAWEGNHLGVAAIGDDGRLRYRWFDGADWQPVETWVDMGGNDLALGPTMVAWAGNWINIFVVDRGGNLWTKWWNGSEWGPAIDAWAPLGGGLQTAPAVCVRNGFELSVFAVGTDGRMKVKWWDGNQWGPSQTGWSDLGGQFAGSPTAISWRGQYVSVMGVGANGQFLYKYWDGYRWDPVGDDWYDLTGDLSGRNLLGASALAWVGRR